MEYAACAGSAGGVWVETRRTRAIRGHDEAGERSEDVFSILERE